MNSFRILVVEDDILISMLLAEVLIGMGHEVCAIATTKADAVAAAIRCKPGLMNVDARFREGSGVAAVEEILRNGYLPHVFVTGGSWELRAMLPGAIVLEKPYFDSELARAIRLAVGAESAP